MNHPTTFELPTKDALTGLLTGAYFRHVLRETLIPEARRTGDPLSVMLFDLDYFLQLNTAHGHEAGDEVLAGVARTLEAVLPDSAVIARYGGDEFAAALPDTRLDDAFTLLEELRRCVAALSFPQWPDIRLTCTMGLAAYPANGQGEVELIREADQALYVAKATGRNKVSLPLADSRMVTKTSH